MIDGNAIMLQTMPLPTARADQYQAFPPTSVEGDKETAMLNSLTLLGAILMILAAALPAIAQFPDLKAVARMLVNENAAIKEGDTVLITGSARDLELLEHLFIEVQRVGGHPMISLTSERLTRRSYAEVPSKYDVKPPTLALKLEQIFAARISIDIGQAEDLLAGVPPARIAARRKASAPLREAIVHKGARTVNLGNDLYPTAALARRLGVPYADLSRSFWAGVGQSPAALKVAGDRLRGTFSAGSQVTITAPNGTRLSFRVAHRPAIVSDGSLTSQVAQPGAYHATWLPAGEFIVTPAPETTDGKAIFDRVIWRGTEVRQLAVTFVKGRIVGMTAVQGYEAIQASYEAAGTGKDEFGYLDIGLNPNIKLPTTSGHIVWMAAGAVTLGIGHNLYVGGTNNSDFSLVGQIGLASVQVGDTVLVRDGKLLEAAK